MGLLLLIKLSVSFGAVLSLRSYLAHSHARAAGEHLAGGRYKAALAEARQAVAIQPEGTYRCLLALALEKEAPFYLDRDRFLSKAEAELEKALQACPTAGDWWVQLARIKEKRALLRAWTTPGQTNPNGDEALLCLERALKTDPRNIYYLMAAAAYHAGHGQKREAAGLIEAAYAYSPQDTARYYLARRERNRPLDRVVAAYLETRLAGQERDSRLLYWLGGLYELQGKYGEARRVYGRGLQGPNGSRLRRLIRRVNMTEAREAKG